LNPKNLNERGSFGLSLTKFNDEIFIKAFERIVESIVKSVVERSLRSFSLLKK
jgi:hypothetical protein